MNAIYYLMLLFNYIVIKITHADIEDMKKEIHVR